MNKTVKIIVIAFALLSFAGTAFAFHAWGPYHWARTSNPFALKLGDNVTPAWDASLRLASTDWSQSTVLDTSVVVGASNPKTCKGVTGRIEVCNSKYGQNGWLGVAQIWITGGEHITKGVVKLNDTYFNLSKYNTNAWRNFVMCQEVGHAFGLDHQDEGFDNANMNTCMDYTNDPTSNQHPNQHDFEELEAIYAHTDTTSTILGSVAKNFGRALVADLSPENEEWGKVVKRDKEGRASSYAKKIGNDEIVVTHVYWAEHEEGGHDHN